MSPRAKSSDRLPCGVGTRFSRPSVPRAVYVLAHGAGAGMDHPFLAAVADALLPHGVATLRFNFPFTDRGGRRPDPPAVAQATIREAIEWARERCEGLPIFAGGKSFGGRMTSHLLAGPEDRNVRGIVYLGFPLHPPKKPSVDRAAHLKDVRVPQLFVQGDRDALADLGLVRKTVKRLGEGATLRVIPDADHGFAVRKRSGRASEAVPAEIAAIVSEWMTSIDA